MKAEFQGRFQGEAKAKEAVPRSLHLKKMHKVIEFSKRYIVGEEEKRETHFATPFPTQSLNTPLLN